MKRITFFYCSTSKKQPGPSPATTPGCNPHYFARVEYVARYLHGFYFSLRYCVAAFYNRGILPSTVWFKTTRGKTASMELGDLSRHGKEFKREVAIAIGRSEGVWRLNLTNRCNSAISSDKNRVVSHVRLHRTTAATRLATAGNRHIRQLACFGRGDADAHGAKAMIVRPDYYVFGAVRDLADLPALPGGDLTARLGGEVKTLAAQADETELA